MALRSKRREVGTRRLDDDARAAIERRRSAAGRFAPTSRRQVRSASGVLGRAAMAAVSNGAPTAPPPTETMTSPLPAVASGPLRQIVLRDIAGVDGTRLDARPSRRSSASKSYETGIGMDQHGIEELAEGLDRLGDPLRRGRAAHHVAHRATRSAAAAASPCAASSSGSSSKRRRVRPKGNCSVISDVAAPRPRSRSSSGLGARGAEGLVERRAVEAATARAALSSRCPQRRQLVETRARPRSSRRPARRPTPAARRSRRPPGRAPGWRRGADGRCPADAAHRRRRARSCRIAGHVRGGRRRPCRRRARQRNAGSASRACAAAGRSCPSRSPAPAGRGSRPCARRRRRAAPPRGDRRRPAADARHGRARRFPAGRLEVEPQRSAATKASPTRRAQLGDACGLPRRRSSSRAGANRR